MKMRLNRRKLLQIVGIGSVGAIATSQLNRPAQAQKTSKSRLLAHADKYAPQIDAGLSYFKDLAAKQLPLVEALEAAIASGDLEASKKAYVDSRPPYEQIEVLALNFEQSDSDIDARPYAFENGEEDEDFKGFHRIEAYLYRDQDLTAALPYAQGLVESIKTLMTDLEARDNFDSSSNFEGIIALATEVPAKKISSEEETWSDQSILIFQENWNGIYSQYKPFGTVLESIDPSAATEVREAYEAAMATVAPYFTEGEVAAQPYSSLDANQRGEIVAVSYRLRDSLINAKGKLGIA